MKQSSEDERMINIVPKHDALLVGRVEGVLPLSIALAEQLVVTRSNSGEVQRLWASKASENITADSAT
jgi:hypothetical protein